VVWTEFKVSGESLIGATVNYHEATMNYAIGAGLYRQIRLDRSDHRVRLISLDQLGTIANKSQGHRTEAVYTVAVQARVGHFDVFSTVFMMPVLASDFDQWLGAAGEGWRPKAPAMMTPRETDPLHEAGKELAVRAPGHINGRQAGDKMIPEDRHDAHGRTV